MQDEICTAAGPGTQLVKKNIVPFAAKPNPADTYTGSGCLFSQLQAGCFISIGAAIGQQNQMVDSFRTQVAAKFGIPGGKPAVNFCSAPCFNVVNAGCNVFRFRLNGAR